MKQLHINKIISTLLILLFVVTSCDKDFDEINTNPNSFTDVPAHFLLPGSILSIANLENNAWDGFVYPITWMQYMAMGDWSAPANYDYEIGRSYLWNGSYRGPLADLDYMTKLAVEEENTALQAIGLILHSYSYSLVVNAFGDIPYFEAFKVDEGINQPKFDEQTAVFDAILENLRTAENLLKSSTTLNFDESYDLVYSGDITKWLKFGNSLRFRLLMQLSGIRDVSDEVASISPLFEDNSDNALFHYPGDKSGATYEPASSLGPDAPQNAYRIAETIVEQLVSTNDPRLPYYALPNRSGEYTGAPLGLYFDSADTLYSKINPTRFDKDAVVTFMDYSELMFLKAEAAKKDLMNGNPESMLAEAISANMERIGVSAGEATTYTDALLSNGTTLDEIYTEKWVSMFGRSMQSWTDYRRTKSPNLRPISTGIIDVIPRRFKYPLSEQTSNSANLSEAISRLDNGDALDSKLIWTVN